MERPWAVDRLRLEMDTLWGTDLYGRPPRSHPLFAVATAEGRRIVRFASGVPEEWRREMSAYDSSSTDEASPPPEMQIYGERLAPQGTGALILRGGPSYVFSEDALIPPVPSGLAILTSNEGTRLASARPEAWWEPQEWADLLAGRLGPWAIGLVEGNVVAICHTPVASSVAAEAGVWTHPEARRQGYGAVVTAAWAQMAAPHFDILFYSTSAENVASQGIARRLRLQPIGWIWQLRQEP